MDALSSFIEHIKNDPVRGILSDHYLKTLESRDASNPEFLDCTIDAEWILWRKAYYAGNAARNNNNAKQQ